jgi:hypothetical protein
MRRSDPSHSHELTVLALLLGAAQGLAAREAAEVESCNVNVDDIKSINFYAQGSPFFRLTGCEFCSKALSVCRRDTANDGEIALAFAEATRWKQGTTVHVIKKDVSFWN